MYFFAFVALCAFTLPAAGYLYQRIGAYRDRRRYTASGRWIDIGGGCNRYLLEHGTGNPAVIFESGIAATNLNWCHIQESVSQFTHTVSYDRGGLGWSSQATTARTPGNIARELQDMLQAAGIKPPYVLVGHSFGGLVMRRFALMYPEKVSGIVLIDPMRPEEWLPLDPTRQSELSRGLKLSKYAVPIAHIGLARLAVISLLCRSGRMWGYLAAAAGDGATRVLGRIQGEVSKMPDRVRPAIAAHWSRPSYFAGMRNHVEAIPATVREMQNAGPIGNIPITLLTPATSSLLCEEALRGIGEDVQQVLAARSTHWVHLDEPDLVIESIREMILAVTPDPVTAST